MALHDSKIWTPIAFVAGVGVGLLLATHCGIKPTGEISAGDFLEALTSIALVTVVYSAAGQLSDRQKFLVEHVMGEVDELSEILRSIDRFYDEAVDAPRSLDECQRAVRDFRRAVNQANDVGKRLDIVGFGVRCRDSLRRVRESIGSFKQLATADGFPIHNYQLSQRNRTKYAACSATVQEAITKLVRDLVS